MRNKYTYEYCDHINQKIDRFDQLLSRVNNINDLNHLNVQGYNKQKMIAESFYMNKNIKRQPTQLQKDIPIKLLNNNDDNSYKQYSSNKKCYEPKVQQNRVSYYHPQQYQYKQNNYHSNHHHPYDNKHNNQSLIRQPLFDKSMIINGQSHVMEDSNIKVNNRLNCSYYRNECMDESKVHERIYSLYASNKANGFDNSGQISNKKWFNKSSNGKVLNKSSNILGLNRSSNVFDESKVTKNNLNKTTSINIKSLYKNNPNLQDLRRSSMQQSHTQTPFIQQPSIVKNTKSFNDDNTNMYRKDIQRQMQRVYLQQINRCQYAGNKQRESSINLLDSKIDEIMKKYNKKIQSSSSSLVQQQQQQKLQQRYKHQQYIYTNENQKRQVQQRVQRRQYFMKDRLLKVNQSNPLTINNKYKQHTKVNINDKNISNSKKKCSSGYIKIEQQDVIKQQPQINEDTNNRLVRQKQQQSKKQSYYQRVCSKNNNGKFYQTNTQDISINMREDDDRKSKQEQKYQYKRMNDIKSLLLVSNNKFVNGYVKQKISAINSINTNNKPYNILTQTNKQLPQSNTHKYQYLYQKNQSSSQSINRNSLINKESSLNKDLFNKVFHNIKLIENQHIKQSNQQININLQPITNNSKLNTIRKDLNNNNNNNNTINELQNKEKRSITTIKQYQTNNQTNYRSTSSSFINQNHQKLIKNKQKSSISTSMSMSKSILVQKSIQELNQKIIQYEKKKKQFLNIQFRPFNLDKFKDKVSINNKFYDDNKDYRENIIKEMDNQEQRQQKQIIINVKQPQSKLETSQINNIKKTLKNIRQQSNTVLLDVEIVNKQQQKSLSKQQNHQPQQQLQSKSINSNSNSNNNDESIVKTVGRLRKQVIIKPLQTNFIINNINIKSNNNHSETIFNTSNNKDNKQCKQNYYNTSSSQQKSFILMKQTTNKQTKKGARYHYLHQYLSSKQINHSIKQQVNKNKNKQKSSVQKVLNRSSLLIKKPQNTKNALQKLIVNLIKQIQLNQLFTKNTFLMHQQRYQLRGYNNYQHQHQLKRGLNELLYKKQSQIKIKQQLSNQYQSISYINQLQFDTLLIQQIKSDLKQFDRVFGNYYQSNNVLFNNSGVGGDLIKQSPQQSNSIKQIIYAYQTFLVHWLRHLKHQFNTYELIQSGFTLQQIDYQTKGFISIQDILKFINNNTGSKYHTNDLTLIWHKIINSLPKQSLFIHKDNNNNNNKITFQSLLTVFDINKTTQQQT